VISHPTPPSDLPRSLQLGPSVVPPQRVCGALALNEKCAMHHEAVIDVSLKTLESIAKLETSWKELEARVTHSFFLSWLWIGTGGHKSHLANKEHAAKWIAIGRDSPERRIEAKLRGTRRMLRPIATNLPKKKLPLGIPYLGASS
jgi:hypothetical protein